MNGEATDTLAARVAERMRVPILVLAIAGGGLLVARLLGLGVTDAVTIGGTVAVGLPTLALFICAVFDPRFHNAVSVVNAEARKRVREKRQQAVGDPAFHITALALLPVFVFSVFRHDGPASALGFAVCNLVLLAKIAALTRGQPTDRFVI